MPESKRRKGEPYQPPVGSQKAVKLGSPPWLAPVMVAFFIIGLLWIVAYYIAGNTIPIMDVLNWWNIVIGFGFIGAGFLLSTRWR